ncbi:E3 ubiquitin-protein ligase RNF115 [Vanessa atalanta]|uniref:E3 ubiquitin-protein ligase RNF115 n=1 Tax=Vanessa atalanta TaxID=42275 RepID=UPI001FCDE0AD|nr:E3 ubiquitin-protein ligase RNF115 [Vanessa atalanta]
MADAIVERRPNTRFFCHRCLVEFEDVLQEFICPYCEGGFIEQLEEAEGIPLSGGDDYSDADMSNIEDMSNVDEMSNLDDSDEVHRSTPPMLNDLAFLMSGGRLRGIGTGTASTNSSATGTGNNAGNGTNTTRRPTVMDELIWMVSGGRPPAGAMTAGAPFVLVGTPGDYVFGGEGLDAVVTQLLGQLEHSGPPPLPRERLAALPTEQVTAEQAAANTACSVCWENFQLGETTARLECEHVFHQSCITPWLQLHATCPICRRSLLPPGEPPAPPARPDPAAPAVPARSAATLNTARTANPQTQIRLAPRVVIRRATGPLSAVIRRFPSQTHTWDSLNNTSTSGSSPASSVTAGGIWAPQTRTTNSSGSNNSSTSLNSNDRDLQYNTDIDYD